MKKDTTDSEPTSTKSRDVLTEILRQGAQEMLGMAVENEVAEYIADHEQMRDANGHHLVVRNGHLSARTIQTGVGPVEVQQPRANDKRIDENGQCVHFSSKILPPYLRRTKNNAAGSTRPPMCSISCPNPFTLALQRKVFINHEVYNNSTD